MGEFTMPSLGADMDKGTLTEWLVAPGDQVARGDIVAVIQTEKSDVEVEVFESGTVEELLVEPGTEVVVGTPLARIGTGESAAPTPATAAAPAADTPLRPPPPSAAVPPPLAASAPAPAPGGPSGRHASLVLSPVVRHLAEERRVDLDQLQGSGPGGRITRADVEAATSATPEPAGAAQAPTQPLPARPAATGERVVASPYARRQAAEAAIELAKVVGSGPGGAIRARDLSAAPVPGATPPLDRKAAMRTAIARLMSTANREIPHYHVSSTLDVGRATAWLEDHNASVAPGERILPAAMLLRATALAAIDVPEINGWWRDDRFTPATHVDLGVAISLRGGGVVTPTIARADELALGELMAALRTLVSRSRRGNLRGSDLAPASLTVTNLGEQGAEEVLGVIHPPQVALVGFGRPTDRVLAIDGQPVVRPTVRATLSGDHRATDGHAGSLLLAAIASRLDRPDQL
jgi:pyruvate dehydrogenase E2 component (dihydrolipoamide acetyltransferase)